MSSFRLINRFKFFVERQFVKGARYQFLAMAIVLAVFSLVGGVLILGTEPGEGLAETVWWAFLRLSDPGYLGDDVGIRRRFVSTILTMSGYVLVLGTVVAILTRWLITFMRQLERGLTPVVMEDHILVLGWTDRTIPVLTDILLSSAKIRRFLERRGRKKRVRLAVLADDVTPEMAHELRTDQSLAKRVRDVVLRSGSALDDRHLERVACLDAAAIIVPTEIFDDQSPISSDVRTIKTLLTLEGLTQQSAERLPYVVAEIQDSRKIPITERAYTGPLEIIAGDAAISELMVQIIHHPGLSRIFRELLSAELGNEFVIHSFEQLSGESFDDAAQRFEDAILCGVIRNQDGAANCHLNPSPDFVLGADDGLLFIAEPNRDIAPQEVAPTSSTQDRIAPVEDDPPVSTTTNSTTTVRRKVLLLGWSQKVITVLREFATYENEVIDVTVMSTYPAAERKKEIEAHDIELPEGGCRHIEADYTVRRKLAAIEPARFDNIIMVISDRMTAGEESDARTIVGYLCLREVLRNSPDRPHVLVELADDNNQELLHKGGDEMIISPLMVSHILAQVAMHRNLRAVLEDLFTFGGAELSFRSCADYKMPHETASFRSLQRRARQFGDILIGIDGTLNPPSASQWKIDDDVELISLTTIDDDGPRR